MPDQEERPYPLQVLISQALYRVLDFYARAWEVPLEKAAVRFMWAGLTAHYPSYEVRPPRKPPSP
jgi:hypothetical protein